jgi:hypothetical protein
VVSVGLVVNAGRLRSASDGARNTRGTQLSLKCSPARLPTNYPHDWHLGLRCPHWLERRHLNWDWPYYVHSAERSEIVSASHEIQSSENTGPGCKTRHDNSFDTIRANVAAPILPLGLARRTRSAGGFSGAGVGGAERGSRSRLGGLAGFAGSKDCGTGDARDARISRVDFRLVSSNRYRRERPLLLHDLCSIIISRRSPPVRKQLN